MATNDNERVDGRLELTGDKYASIIFDTLERIGGSEFDRKSIVRKLLDSYLHDAEMVGVKRGNVTLLSAIADAVSTLEFVDRLLQEGSIEVANSLISGELHSLISKDIVQLKTFLSPYYGQQQQQQQEGNSNASH